MVEWIYRATADQADWETTDDLLTSHCFLWRSAYAHRRMHGRPRLIANVQHVRRGDRIHVAFSGLRDGITGLEGIGSFEILGDPHPDTEGHVEDERQRLLSLLRVHESSELARRLAATSYARDPHLEVFTGWHVREIEKREIAFDAAMFPGNSALHRFEAPSVFRSLGVDWSGSAEAGRKVWAAAIDWRSTGEGELAFLRRPFERLAAPEVAAKFRSWLERQAFNVAGLDFCFGLAQEHAALEWPRTGPADLGRWLEKQCGEPVSFKRTFSPERRRKTDRHRHAPFAPTNLRMFRQTYWGLRALAGLTVPIPPWREAGRRAVVEVLPADVVRAVCPGCHYKGHGEETRGERERLLQAVEREYRITIQRDDAEMLLRDNEGDALDAVLAAVAAGTARRDGFARPEWAADVAESGEGWIYSVT